MRADAYPAAPTGGWLVPHQRLLQNHATCVNDRLISIPMRIMADFRRLQTDVMRYAQ